MKVTAILPEEMVEEVKKLSQGKNITDSLKIALQDWIKIQKLRQLNQEVKNTPVNFQYTAAEIRKINREW
jgi:hypothetical protein